MTGWADSAEGCWGRKEGRGASEDMLREFEKSTLSKAGQYNEKRPRA